MNRGKFAAAALILILLSVSLASAQTPRNPPSNDVAPNAIDIALNAKYKVENADLATTEIGETGCAYPHSVWFKFTAPFTGSITISTVGSVLIASPAISNGRTVVAIFSSTPTEPDLISCNISFGGAGVQVAGVSVTSGETYYIKVATSNPALLSGSSYKFRTWMQLGIYDFDVFDTGFEESSLEWTVKNALNGDGVVCGTGEDHLGNCAFKFIGGANEATSVKQTVTWPTAQFVGAVDQAVFGAGWLKRTGTAIDFTIKLKLTYSDGTPDTKAKTTITTSSANYGDFQVQALIESPNLIEVQYKFKNKSTDGSVLMDTVALSYYGGLVRDTGGGLLPVPAALQ